MAVARFRFANDEVQSFDIDSTSDDAPSAFMVGIKKGGSTLLAKMVRDLMPFSQKVLFEYPRLCFSNGLPHRLAVEDVDNIFQKKGYVFGVFRWAPENDIINLNMKQNEGENPFLLLLRDPRDALVSLYFSDAKSHAIPKTGPLRKKFLDKRDELKRIDIDDYVLMNAPTYLRHFYRTLQIDTLSTTTTIRYEDIVYDKHKLSDAIINAIQCDISKEDRQIIVTKHDVIPGSENEDAHIRQVHPGNFRKKLKPETIEELNDCFSVILRVLNYDV